MSYGITNNPSMPLNYWLEGLKNQYKETKVKTATFIKELDDFRGDARLYKLSNPLLKESYDWDDEKIKAGYNYVVVSAVNVEFSGTETYILGADKNGKVLVINVSHDHSPLSSSAIR